MLELALVASLPYAKSANCQTVYETVELYKAAQYVATQLTNVDPQGGPILTAPSTYHPIGPQQKCSQYDYHQETLLRVCRSGDSRDPQPHITFQEAFTVAEAILAFCNTDGQMNGKMTYVYEETDGAPNELDIYLSGVNFGHRRLLQAGFGIRHTMPKEAGAHGSPIYLPRSARKLQEDIIDTLVVVDDGYLCVFLPDSPFILRREVFVDSGNPNNLRLGTPGTDEEAPTRAEEIAGRLGMAMGQLIDDGSTQTQVGYDTEFDNELYNANWYMLPQGADASYLGDLDSPVQVVQNPVEGEGDGFLAAYQLLLNHMVDMINREFVLPGEAALLGVNISTFGIYKRGEDNEFRPSQGLTRIAGVAFQVKG